MNILVTGGRDYWRCGTDLALDELHRRTPVTLLIQGGAPGADTHARDWALRHGVHVATIEALWDTYGDKAGSKRNSVMATLAPAIDLLVAFPGGVGSANMIDKTQDAGSRVWGRNEE